MTTNTSFLIIGEGARGSSKISSKIWGPYVRLHFFNKNLSFSPHVLFYRESAGFSGGGRTGAHGQPRPGPGHHCTQPRLDSGIRRAQLPSTSRQPKPSMVPLSSSPPLPAMGPFSSLRRAPSTKLDLVMALGDNGHGSPERHSLARIGPHGATAAWTEAHGARTAASVSLLPRYDVQLDVEADAGAAPVAARHGGLRNPERGGRRHCGE